MGPTDQIYRYLPVWAQHAGVSLFGYYWKWLRFGPGYQQELRAFQARERYGADEWENWRSQQVAELLRIAVSQVPFYRETWTDVHKQAALQGSLQRLPLLEKNSLRANPWAFVRDDIRPRRPLVFHTSGSTGTPIATIWSRRDLRRSMALREARSARWAHVSFNKSRATFSGRSVEPDPRSTGPFYRFNLAEGQAYLSAFHIKPESAAAYAEALRRHQVEWLTGYAVSCYLLARLFVQQGIVAPALKAVITTSEKLTPEMRAVIERAFCCRVYEEYSTVEQAVFASECENGRLHVSPDASLVEILDQQGNPCKPGQPGEVVATCFLREVQPLIRYRLGDVAAWDPAPCPCGRSMPVLREVVGRIEDVVVTRDGRSMVRFHGIFVGQPNIREGQVIQETIDRIRVKVVTAPSFGEHDRHDIVQRVQSRLGPDVTVVVEQVDEIPRTRAGKFKAVVSQLATGAHSGKQCHLS